MVELVEFLSQLIGVVGNQCRTIGAACFLYHAGKVGNALNDSNFLVVRSNAVHVQSRHVVACLALERADAGIGVLDEWPGVAVEVDTLGRIEEHVLAWVNLEDEVLERTHAYDACHLTLLVDGHSLEAVACHCHGVVDHLVHQVVGIDHRSLARLHFAVRQLYHAIGEVDQVLAPLESQLVEQEREHLEVIVLLIAHHIYHLVDGIVLIAQLSGANVLSHVDAGTVATQQQLVVQAIGSEVGPHAVVVLAVEHALGEAFLHLFFSFEIGLALVVNLVEVHAHALVGLVETGINPAVHLLPQRAHLGVVVLPLLEHLASLMHESRLLLGLLFANALSGSNLLNLGLVVLVEEHIEVANQVVALLASALGSGAIAPLEPREHRLADVDATVVDDIGLHHLVATGFHNLCQTESQQVVAHMAQVERLVGVGRAVLYHHELTLGSHLLEAVVLVAADAVEQLCPERRLDSDV